jgi:hypothetical protein
MSFHLQPHILTSQLPVSTPTGPNDARHVVWALGAFFFTCIFYLFALLLPFASPQLMFQPPATLFDHPTMSFHSQPHVFNTHQPFPAPQFLKHAYKQLYACFLHFFFFSFSSPQNTCTSNCTCVSYLFSFFFSFFFILFSPLNACTSNRTRVS